MNVRKFRFVTIAVVVVNTLLALSSSAQDSTQFENVDPGPAGEAVAAAEATFEVPPQPGRILLLKGSDYHDGSQALGDLGYEYTSLSSEDLETTNLNEFDIILVAWAPYQATIDALNARKV